MSFARAQAKCRKVNYWEKCGHRGLSAGSDAQSSHICSHASKLCKYFGNLIKKPRDYQPILQGRVMNASQDGQYNEQLRFLLAFVEGRIVSFANKAQPYCEWKISSVDLFGSSCKMLQ